MVLVELTCVIVGEGRAFDVEIDDGKKVSALKEKIKKKKPNTIKVQPDDLKLFLAKQGGEWMDVDAAEALSLSDDGGLPGFKEMNRRFWLKNEEHFGLNFTPQEDQVHVLVVVPDETESQRAKRQKLSLQDPRYQSALEWTDPELRAQLHVEDGGQLIKMQEPCVKGTGVGIERYPLILFRRQGLIDEWNKIDYNSIQAGSLLWICGPPGTGKSCAALAFACSLNPSLWDVVWVHYSRDVEFNCVRMQKGVKQTCSFSEYDVETLLPQVLEPVSSSRKTIVFLDGYVSDSDNAKRAYRVCNSWRKRDLDLRRLVCVSSMAVVGKECRLEGVAAIADTDEELLEKSLFDLFSWTLEDYMSAIKNTEFFKTVQDKFPPYCPQPGIEESEEVQRKKRLEEKYFVAGGSARVMFEFSPKNAIQYVKRALKAVPNFKICSDMLAGCAASTTINRLLAIYPVGDDDSESRLVSGYAMRALAIKLGPDVLKNMASLHGFNPSVDGYIFESWFFAMLTTCGVTWKRHVTDTDASRPQWERSVVTFFDPTKLKLIMTSPKKWLAPVKWNQSGYDAVYIDTEGKRVRFVRVTRALTHSFNHLYFVDVLNRLAALEEPPQFDVFCHPSVQPEQVS